MKRTLNTAINRSKSERGYEFHSNGRVFASTSAVTCVRVELFPQVLIQGAQNRHRIGIGESVICLTYPQSLPCEISATKNGAVVEGFGNRKFKSPFSAESNGLRFAFPNGLKYEPELDVIEPSHFIVTRAVEIVYSNAIPNMAGWCGMSLELSLAPTNVSFQALDVMEVPETDEGGIAPTGFFLNEQFSNEWHHTTFCGAGNWFEVGAGNHFATDKAEFSDGHAAPWSSGSITWRIPMAWRPSDDTSWPLGHVVFGEPYFQTFTIDAAGTVRVEKLGCWVERSPDGTRRKSSNTE